MTEINDIMDLDRFPLDQPGSAALEALIQRCKDDLARTGMFNLEGLMRPDRAAATARQLHPALQSESFLHQRAHNVYFKKEVPGLAADHPALTLCQTVNHTLCADQLAETPVTQIYEYLPLIDFLARCMDRPRLYAMDDPLARLNVIAYRDGEALNWHFDRSEFTTTLLLQAPAAGGEFVYRTDLRSPDDPNYDGVARVLRGEDARVEQMAVSPGTLNVFKGINTLHKVAPVRGNKERVIAVFSYYERPGVRFSDEESMGFYGRTAQAVGQR